MEREKERCPGPSFCRMANSCKVFLDWIQTSYLMTSRHVKKIGNSTTMTVAITIVLLSTSVIRINECRKNQKDSAMTSRHLMASSHNTSARSMTAIQRSQVRHKSLIRIILTVSFSWTITQKIKITNPKTRWSRSMGTRSKISLRFKLKFWKGGSFKTPTIRIWKRRIAKSSARRLDLTSVKCQIGSQM